MGDESPDILSIPATHADAVHTFADRQVAHEHVLQLRPLCLSKCSPWRQEASIHEIVSRSASRADQLSRKIWQPLTDRGRSIFGDMDLARRTPGAVATLPRVQWLMGALAALAFVRSAHTEALLIANISQGQVSALLMQSLERYLADADHRWSVQWSRVLQGYPEVVASAEAVQLVALETASPRFEVTARVM